MRYITFIVRATDWSWLRLSGMMKGNLRCLWHMILSGLQETCPCHRKGEGAGPSHESKRFDKDQKSVRGAHFAFRAFNRPTHVSSIRYSTTFSLLLSCSQYFSKLLKSTQASAIVFNSFLVECTLPGSPCPTSCKYHTTPIPPFRISCMYQHIHTPSLV